VASEEDAKAEFEFHASKLSSSPGDGTLPEVEKIIGGADTIKRSY
jgi:hypothetical protein